MDAEACPEGAWDVARARPHPGLWGLIRHYQGVNYALSRPRLRLEIPHDSVTLFLGFADPVELRRPTRQPAVVFRYTSLLAGLQTEPVIGRHRGKVRGIEISMTPWGAHALLRTDMAEIAQTHVDAGDLPGLRWARLAEALADAPGWPARFALLNRILLKQADRGTTWAPETAQAWRRLAASGGALAGPELAAEVGWSPRKLAKAFREQLGLTPKAVSRVMRLQRALRLLLDGMPQAQAAADCGFYDQPHLALEFKQMTGGTPGDFLAARRLVQAVPAGDRVEGRVTSVLLS